jgi:hypothetical protein
MSSKQYPFLKFLVERKYERPCKHKHVQYSVCYRRVALEVLGFTDSFMGIHIVNFIVCAFGIIINVQIGNK